MTVALIPIVTSAGRQGGSSPASARSRIDFWNTGSSTMLAQNAFTSSVALFGTPLGCPGPPRLRPFVLRTIASLKQLQFPVNSSPVDVD